MNIFMKLVYQYMTIFLLSHPHYLHPLQVENCDSNSRLLVGEDDDGKFRIQRVNTRPPGIRYHGYYMSLALQLRISCAL